MPLHPTLSKMLLCGALFGVLAPVATIAAALACKSPFLLLPIDESEAARLQRVRQRLVDPAIPNSDFVVLLRLFDEWSKAPNPAIFCADHWVAHNVMREIAKTRALLLQLFQRDLRFGTDEAFERHSSNKRLASSIVALCLAPHNAHKKFVSENKGGKRKGEDKKMAMKRWWSPDARAYAVIRNPVRVKGAAKTDEPYLVYVQRLKLDKRRVLLDNVSQVSLLPVVFGLPAGDAYRRICP
eukprot:TRINITY_DN3156_c0_g1_i1.p2 TRINITY_DN3156_c0_g1~~TRINITY_DN3156_c0_g1_i1.p2  ORF type:complete len:240 (-),score=58.12 TRINITY_DN3156_c0_g1_i1:370-1089(-)